MEESEDSGFEDSPDVRSASPLFRPASHIHFEPPPLPLIPLSGFEHSLVPDMMLGWRPKLTGGPIPLVFNRCTLPVSVNPATKREFATVFHGFRPRDSQAMHEALAHNYPVPRYQALEAFRYLHQRDTRLQDFRPFQGTTPDCDLHFDSTFESGNLDKAVQTAEDEFELYMRADANTRGHHQWYYFAVTVASPRTVRFHILNFTKNESLYSQGMLPVVKAEALPHLGWHRAGLEVRYGPSKLNRSQRRAYFSLSFSYSFEPAGKVFFAYAVPYTYSYLRTTIIQLSAHASFCNEVLCKSLSGVEVPLLTITDSRNGTVKPHVVMMGRIHPGETHGSWVLHGLLHFLLSTHPAATALREKLVILIVPMANPDGVIMGNYRTGFSGKDLNRQFKDPDPQLHPTVAAIKALVTRTVGTHSLLAFLDFHAHSRKKHIFLYGPRHPLHSRKYYDVRVLPKLICQQGTPFRYAACKFTSEACKQTTARLVMWRELKVTNSFTLEASLYGYLTAERSTVAFTQECLEKAGRDVAIALHQYVQFWEEEQRLLVRKSALRQVIDQLQPEPQSASSSDSDSFSSQDELPLEDQRLLRGQILAALQRPSYPILRSAKPLEPRNQARAVLKASRLQGLLTTGGLGSRSQVLRHASPSLALRANYRGGTRLLLKTRRQLSGSSELRSLSCARLNCK